MPHRNAARVASRICITDNGMPMLRRELDEEFAFDELHMGGSSCSLVSLTAP